MVHRRAGCAEMDRHRIEAKIRGFLKAVRTLFHSVVFVFVFSPRRVGYSQ